MKAETLKKAFLGTLMASVVQSAQGADYWARTSIDYDTRNNARWNVRGGASNLPLGIRAFGFADFDTPNNRFDTLKNPYLEARLFKKTENGFGAALEYNRDFNSSDNIFRLGPIWEMPLPKKHNASLGIKVFPLATKDKGFQLGIYGRKSWKNEDMYVEGYIDYNFKPDRVVSEIQFGKHISGNMYGITEFRYTGFQKKNNIGVGIGLEWKF